MDEQMNESSGPSRMANFAFVRMKCTLFEPVLGRLDAGHCSAGYEFHSITENDVKPPNWSDHVESLRDDIPDWWLCFACLRNYQVCSPLFA
jgi:hypothetical protein